jgi:aspartyl-tRNA(Asn)/glutamyl-tRNA(Gln) amidotransferase subunit A
MKSNIIDLHNAFLKQDFSYVNDAHKKETENQYRQNITVKTLNDISNLDGDKSSLLYGVPYTLKDLYSTKGIRTTGGSKILEQYLPPFNSQVYELLTKNGGILISKSNLDEFGMGGSGLYGPYGDIINPYDSNYIVGGSSGGSAVQVATNIVPFSVVTDTADSARSPASYLGIVGFKPSYGAISRYGVIPYAPSLDTVGILANYVADISIVNHILAAHDERDFTSQKNITTCELPKTIDNIKISVIKGIEEFLPQQIKDIYLDNINSLSKKYEITYVDFSLELIETISPIYMIISYAEAASTFSNYTGITFGKTIQEKNFQNSAKAFRSANFSNMVKRKLIIGNKFLND